MKKTKSKETQIAKLNRIADRLKRENDRANITDRNEPRLSLVKAWHEAFSPPDRTATSAEVKS